jgi:uncharacterized membrane protein
MTYRPRWAVHLAAGGPDISRRTGQRLARQQLAKVSVWQRILRFLGRLFSGTGSVIPHGYFGLIVLVLILVVVVVAILFWVRPARAGRARSSALLVGGARRAADYRADAERRAAAGDYSRATVERVRAIAAELEQREIVPARPGRTADEMALEAGRELPGLATDLRAAMTLFDDILYGDKSGSPDGYDLVTRVDAAVRTADVVPGTQAAEPAGLAVPR